MGSEPAARYEDRVFSNNQLGHAVMFEPRQPTIVSELPDADLLFWPHGFSAEESDRLFQRLMAEVDWQQEHITLYGRKVPLPRLTAWFGEVGYSYSGLHHAPCLWTPALIEIKATVETLTATAFNSVLLNLYRTGQDSVAWHSDDESELEKNPVIASVSLGAARRFSLRQTRNPKLRKDYVLTHGSLLLMRGATQHFWQHQVPKTTQPILPRINLTFRQIVYP